MNNTLLEKFTNNHKLLFIVPYLMVLTRLCIFYNNEANLLDFSFFDYLAFAIIWLLVYFIFDRLIKLLLKDKHKIFIINFLFCCLLMILIEKNIILYVILGFIIFIFNTKFFIRFKLNNFVGIMMFISISMFIINFIPFTFNLSKRIIFSKSYNNDIEEIIDEGLSSPNIYWIHCDAMPSVNVINNYFYFNNQELRNYFEDNGFYHNDNASLVAGYRTQRALVALFNPNYYDNFMGEFLNEYEDYKLGNSNGMKKYLSYYELEDKRLNNEFFKLLKDKGYTTISVTKFNQYASLYTDYIYDYYGYDRIDDFRVTDTLKDLSNNSHNSLKAYIRFNHFQFTAGQSMLHFFTDNIRPIKYEVVDYSDIDVSGYKYLQSTEYWPIKSFVKVVDLYKDIDSNKFIYMDFDLNHMPLTFDSNGRILNDYERSNAAYYIDNYKYSSKLLIEFLDYIKNNDSEAIIIVQADHGIHTLNDKDMKNIFKVDNEQMQELRNSVVNAVYIPDKYKNDDDIYLNNPLNISRYITNNFVGKNYEYIK